MKGQWNAEALLIFARVVDLGSFSAAAAKLALPKSTVSRRVAALEDGLGERLLLRTTRRLALTEFGGELLAHARGLADEVDAARHRRLGQRQLRGGRAEAAQVDDAGEDQQVFGVPLSFHWNNLIQ